MQNTLITLFAQWAVSHENTGNKEGESIAVIVSVILVFKLSTVWLGLKGHGVNTDLLRNLMLILRSHIVHWE